MNLHNDIGIYAIVNRVTGKYYIGSTHRNFYDRWCAHRSTLKRRRHSSIHLQHSFNKYGLNAFVFKVLEIVPAGISKEDMAIKEIGWINYLNSHDPMCGYNISFETSNARLGHTQSKKTRNAISRKLTGIKRSEEFKQNMSRTRSGELHYGFGKKQDHELAMKRVKHTYRSVIRCDGKVYECLRAAADDLGVSPANVSQSLRKGYKCKGFYFRYYNSNQENDNESA